jgi:hypothetical protein
MLSSTKVIHSITEYDLYQRATIRDASCNTVTTPRDGAHSIGRKGTQRQTVCVEHSLK